MRWVTHYEDNVRHPRDSESLSRLEDQERAIQADDPDLQEQGLQQVLIQLAPVRAEPLEQLDDTRSRPPSVVVVVLGHVGKIRRHAPNHGQPSAIGQEGPVGVEARLGRKLRRIAFEHQEFPGRLVVESYRHSRGSPQSFSLPVAHHLRHGDAKSLPAPPLHSQGADLADEIGCDVIVLCCLPRPKISGNPPRSQPILGLRPAPHARSQALCVSARCAITR